MPGRRREGVAPPSRDRAAARAVLPRCVHAAGPNRRHRLPEQGRDLRHPVQDVGRDADHDRSRPQAPRSTHRCLVRSSYLGLCAHPSSARAHDRAGGWVRARRHQVGRLPAGLLPPGARALAPVPPTVPGEARCRSSNRSITVLRQARSANECTSLRRLFGTAAQQRMGGLQQAPVRGPEEVLRYLARYTHRVAIPNRRLVALDDNGVTFEWKDYRVDGPERYKLMTLDTHEFIRRFLMHVLPQGFHRIRYYGFPRSPPR